MKKQYIVILLTVLAFTSGCGASDNSDQQQSSVDSHVKTTSSTSTANDKYNASKSPSLISEEHYAKATVALGEGNYDLAISEADAAIEADSNNGDAYSLRGMAKGLDGNPTDGLADVKHAYELSPDDASIYYNMAMVYKLDGQLEASKTWFEKVLEKDPNNTWSIYGIATIYADRGDDKNALEWLKWAIATDPKVKPVAATQDHFERFHGNPIFEILVK